MRLAEDLRHETIAAHRVEHARLAEQHHKDDRRETGQNRDRHELAEPRVAGHEGHDRLGDRRFLTGRAEELDRRHTAQHVREEHVENRADHQRTENADRHVLLRVLGFLRRGRDGVESDEREEHDAGRTKDAHDAAVWMDDALRRGEGRRFGDVRRVVRGADEAPANHDHRAHDRDLGDDDDAVDEGGFLRAADEQQREHEQDANGRNVHGAGDRDAVDQMMLQRRVAPFPWHVEAHVLEHFIEVLAPRDGDGGRTDRVFEHQVPANDPRDQLTHRRVGVRVCAARDRNHRGKFRVAEPGERAAQTGHEERERDGRAGALGNRRRRSHKQTRTDNRADAQGHQLHRSQGALQ